jgi:hypothetical protein
MTSFRRRTTLALLGGMMVLGLPAAAVAGQSHALTQQQAAEKVVREFASDQMHLDYAKACKLMTPAFHKQDLKLNSEFKPSEMCSVFGYYDQNLLLGVVWNGVGNKPFNADLNRLMSNNVVTRSAGGDFQVVVNNGGPLVTLSLKPSGDSYRISGASEHWPSPTGTTETQWKQNNAVATRFAKYYDSTLKHSKVLKGTKKFPTFARSAKLLTGQKLLAKAQALFPTLTFSLSAAPDSGATPGTYYLGSSTSSFLVVVSYTSTGVRMESGFLLLKVEKDGYVAESYVPGEIWPAATSASATTT